VSADQLRGVIDIITVVRHGASSLVIEEDCIF
jgi:hypothetical protein